MEAILVPLGICVVLPVAIVWLVCYYLTRRAEKKAEVLLKAIEKGVEINPDTFLINSKKSKPLKIRLLNKLQAGIIFLLAGLCLLIWSGSAVVNFVSGLISLSIGITLIVMFFVGKKWLSAEIKAEEENL